MAVFKLENVEDHYEIGEVIGSGHFGKVREVRERASGTRWAGKFLQVERKSVEKEVEILQKLQHENIMALRDAYECRVELVLIVELILGGELFDFIAEKENLLESEAIEFLKQILQGVGYMHSRNIAHFDLKPENIMLAEKEAPNPHIKIIDFGLSQVLTEEHEYRSQRGTPQYIAPEVINYEPLGPATDMWSVGVITYILLSGMSPFQGYTDEETLKNIVSMNYEFDERCFKETSDLAKDFIQNLLVKEPKSRMTADESVLHPWIRPLTRKHAVDRKRSSINMKNFKKFNAKRKWKLSFNMVWMCNHLNQLKLLSRKKTKPMDEPRQTESDQEGKQGQPATQTRRRHSSSS